MEKNDTLIFRRSAVHEMLELIGDVLTILSEELDGNPELVKFTPEEIVGKVEKYFDISFTKRTRAHPYPKAKYICCFLLKKHTSLTLSQIGQKVYYSEDHSNALYALNKYDEFKMYPDFIEDANNIMRDLYSKIKKQ
jgi:chromosomal replication initiation ATPase DnaA